MRRCEYCDTPYIRGTMVDVGVGFMQVSEDEPGCDCYEDKGDYHCHNCGTTNVIRDEVLWSCTTCGTEYDIEEE